MMVLLVAYGECFFFFKGTSTNFKVSKTFHGYQSIFLLENMVN